MNNLRKEHMKDKKRIVIKIGSSSLTHKETGDLNLMKIEKLVRVISDLKGQGKEVVLVSSGAIAAGRQALVQCGAINTPSTWRLPARLLQISTDMAQLLDQFRPDAMAVEELFFNQNVTTGIGVAQARGVILTEAERACVPIFEYSPSQVKQAVVGYGKAEKRQVMDMTKRLLGLKDVPKPDDAADAVAIALCHARSASSRLSLMDSARPGSGRYAVRDNRR